MENLLITTVRLLRLVHLGETLWEYLAMNLFLTIWLPTGSRGLRFGQLGVATETIQEMSTISFF